MTEAEWLSAKDPQPMLEFLKGKVSDRKLRLFAVACCRRFSRLITDGSSRNALDVAERLADGLATNAERRSVSLAGCDPTAGVGAAFLAAMACTVGASFQAAERASDSASLLAAIDYQDQRSVAWQRAVDGERMAQVVLLRDMLGLHPLRPITLDTNWLTSTVLALAQQMYDSRDFSPMPILADALQDAGRDNVDVLNHCRQPGVHVRGCWCVDLLLGKT
jgi:hypothetical protein